MSAPLIARRGDVGVLSPTGFILLENALVTVRFCPMAAFDQVHESIVKDRVPVWTNPGPAPRGWKPMPGYGHEGDEP